ALPGHSIAALTVPNALSSLPGRRTGHHIAFETPNGDTQAALMDRLEILGYRHSALRDRKYLSSIYFRESNGVLFEIATSGPGFSVDEEYSSLGEYLQLPEQFESQRKELENSLPKFKYQSGTYKK